MVHVTRGSTRCGRLRGVPVAVLCGAVLCLAARAPAQYDEAEEFGPLSDRSIEAGLVQHDFRPQGTNPTSDSLRIRFQSLMPILAFHQGPLDLSFGYAGYTLHGMGRSSVFVAATFAREAPIAGGRGGGRLLLPLLVSLQYTKAEALGTDLDNFNVASLGIGGGLKYRQSGDLMEFSVEGDVIAHYSFEGYSTTSGFSAAGIANVRVVLRSIHVLRGIVLGYRFRYQTWSMSDSRFNYRSLFHGPGIGVLF